MMRRGRRGLLLLLSVVAVGLPRPALAEGVADVLKELNGIETKVQQLSSLPLRSSQLRGATHVEERLTDGELFYRLQDYVRASVILTDIVDNHPTHSAYPDALFLLGDSLFRAGDYLGARSRFRQLLDRAGEGRFRPFVQRALARLIEIAIRTRDFEGVEDYFASLSRLPPSEVEAATSYFKAKYLYSVAVPSAEPGQESKGAAIADPERLEQARQAFQSVPRNSPYVAQARYFMGVIYTLRGQFEPAIQVFREVTGLKATTPGQRKIKELAHLALGRLYYETDRVELAAEAYQSLPWTSSQFDEALNEIAWAHIRRGDSTRAERALDVLSVAAPDSHVVPDGKILRGNLLLRDGNFNKANQVFGEVTDAFEPVRKQLDRMVSQQPDAAAYFQELVRANMEAFDATTFLPPLALQWTNFEGDMKDALVIVEDLSQARQLVKETSEVIRRLAAAIGSPNPVSIFADLRVHRERTVGLRNRLARVQQKLIATEERVGGGGGSPELAQIKSRRREIERLLGGMPTDTKDFQSRNLQATRHFRHLESQLSELSVAVMGMEARVVATDRFLSDTGKDRTDVEGTRAVRQELEVQREAIREYRDRIAELRIQAETGRLQVGVGDTTYSRDKSLRAEYSRLVARERNLLGGSGSAEGRDIDSAFRRVARAESQLDAHDARVDSVVAERVAEIQGVLEEERAKLQGYRAKLEELAADTETVVAGVTRANFERVRKRFYDLVLKADVGKVDVSWAEREEHRMRVEMLTRERTRQMQTLDDEFKEIVDKEGG